MVRKLMCYKVIKLLKLFSPIIFKHATAHASLVQITSAIVMYSTINHYN